MKRSHPALAAVIMAAGMACRIACARAPAVATVHDEAQLPAEAQVTADAQAATDASAVQAAADSMDSAFGPPRHPALSQLIGDVKDYYTAPLRWNDEQWALFGG